MSTIHFNYLLKVYNQKKLEAVPCENYNLAGDLPPYFISTSSI